jgi:hypothetical protein
MGEWKAYGTMQIRPALRGELVEFAAREQRFTPRREHLMARQGEVAKRAGGWYAPKNLSWAGATPLSTAFSRPKFRGVAPALHAGSVIVFWPRAGVGECNL